MLPQKSSKQATVVGIDGQQTEIPTKNPHQNFDEMEDKVLWKHFKDGKREAFSYIYKTHVQALFIFGQQITKDKELVKDCIHNLFIEVSRPSKKQEEVISIKSYLYKSLYRLLVRSLEKEKKAKSLENDEAFHGFSLNFSDERTLTDEENLKIKKKKIEIIVNRLPKKQRMAFMYYFYEGLTYEEIAYVMGISRVHSARKLVYKAITKIRENIDKAITLLSGIWLLIILFTWLNMR